MSDALVSLTDVSVHFRKHVTVGLKDLVLGKLKPPDWAQAVSLNEYWALQDLSLRLEPGDRLGIIGHNGAGKSTLLKVISRIYRPTRGTVEVRGRVAPLIEIGAGFNPELTGRENAFLNGAILGIPGRVLEKRLDAIIDFSDLKEHFDVPVKYYSTGMLLRLAFSVATEVVPDILILDELFAGADAGFIEKANRRLEKFVRESPIFLLVSHDLQYVERFCNRAIVLEGGRVVYGGDPGKAIHAYMSWVGGSIPAPWERKEPLPPAPP